MKKWVLAKGAGSVETVVAGRVTKWDDSLIKQRRSIRGHVVYCSGDIPLYRIALLIDGGVKAVLMEKGGRNYHPLILLADAGVPGIAGVGKVELADKTVLVDSGRGIVYECSERAEEPEPREKSEIRTQRTKASVYVNVGYPTALEAAARTGADGIGLLRTEFTVARALSEMLDMKLLGTVSVLEAIRHSNEADVVYAIVKDRRLSTHVRQALTSTIASAIDHFGQREIIVRTLDLARDEDDPLGNRGVRRCIAEGRHSIRLIAEAIREAQQQSHGNANIGVILPLVSHYSQVQSALETLLDAGLTLRNGKAQRKTDISFGWEIEQPAASQNNVLWMEAFRKQYGYPPNFIGIGTNDLTQFTIALGRDAYSKEKQRQMKNYLKQLYDESDLSVVRQIYEVATQCKQFGTKMLLLGEAAGKPRFAELMLSLGAILSVPVASVRKVRRLVNKLEKKGHSEEVIREYIERICSQYPQAVQDSVRLRLMEMFKGELCRVPT